MLYFGRVLSFQACQRIDKIKYKDFLFKVSENSWILYAPGRLCELGSFDPVVAKDDLPSLSEILKVKPTCEQKWNSILQSDLDKLNKLVSEDADGDTTQPPATYIAEIMWTTYEPSDDEAKIVNNFRIY